MTHLLDTHVLLWAAGTPARLPEKVRAQIENPEAELFFGAASIWEVAIKNRLGRADFRIDPGVLLRGLSVRGYREWAVTGAHAAAADLFPRIHKDPFDRILIAQARIEGLTLLTADCAVACYPGPIRAIAGG